jgi:hypothetical protein
MNDVSDHVSDVFFLISHGWNDLRRVSSISIQWLRSYLQPFILVLAIDCRGIADSHYVSDMILVC